MKQKFLLMSLFLVFGIFLSGLVANTSLSLTNQIKSTFEKDGNEDLGGFAKPPSGKMTVLEDKVGVDEGIPVLMLLKDKFAPFVGSSPGNSTKTATFYIPLIIFLVIIIYFFMKYYYKKNKNSSQNYRYDIEVAQKEQVVLKAKVEHAMTAFTKEKRVATNIQISEIRRLLQKWEARLIGGKTKKDAETINEWFERINGPVEIIPIYEKIRYGEKTCTEDELKFIKMTLKL